MMETDSRVVFERNEVTNIWSYIEQTPSGQKIDIVGKGNTLIMQMWVPKVGEVAEVEGSERCEVPTVEVSQSVFVRLEEELI